MQSSYTFTVGSAVFDEQNLVSSAALVPVLELAEQNGLSRLIGEHVDLPGCAIARRWSAARDRTVTSLMRVASTREAEIPPVPAVFDQVVFDLGVQLYGSLGIARVVPVKGSLIRHSDEYRSPNRMARRPHTIRETA